MTQQEFELLLTTARILRATLRDMLPTEDRLLDVADLDDALRHWDSNVVLMQPNGESTPTPRRPW